jgi:hypothetical protein
MTSDQYLDIKLELIGLGYANEIDWAESIRPCDSAFKFWCEYVWVVINSGMKNQVANVIWDRIISAYNDGKRAADVFGHKGKATAIDDMWEARYGEFNAYQSAKDKLTHLQTLPWIGPVTKYHLAKNLGLDLCKPDRHLVRIADRYSTTPAALCQRLAQETGDRIGTIDVVLWRAANLGLLKEPPFNVTQKTTTD